MAMKTCVSPEDLKKEFPFFETHPDLVYLDSAATTQKPACVLKAMQDFYLYHNAPVHRAAYTSSLIATDLYESARAKIAQFIGSKEENLVFTKGTTESLNLLASSYEKSIEEGDEILVLETEHHANLLPWQRLAQKTKAKLVKIQVTDSGHIDFDDFQNRLSPRTKIIAIAHMSNVTGAVQDLSKVSELCRSLEAFLIVDGAQGIVHEQVNVSQLHLDAYVFSSHKLYGPTGLGVLHVSSRLLDKLDLYQVGGDVIESVSFEQTRYKKGRARFEAGTPMVAEVIGLKAAIEFLDQLDLHEIYKQEKALTLQIKEALKQMPGIHLIGSSDTGLVSFYSDHVHALDLASYADSKKIALRSGHLCAQPALHRFHTTHAVRISLGLYTTEKDIKKALDVIQEALLFFS